MSPYSPGRDPCPDASRERRRPVRASPLCAGHCTRAMRVMRVTVGMVGYSILLAMLWRAWGMAAGACATPAFETHLCRRAGSESYGTVPSATAGSAFVYRRPRPSQPPTLPTVREIDGQSTPTSRPGRWSTSLCHWSPCPTCFCLFTQLAQAVCLHVACENVVELVGRLALHFPLHQVALQQ